MVGCYIKITAFFVVVGATIFSVNWLSRLSRYFKKYRLVGTVSSLHCYPVASCAGVVNKHATCTTAGLKMVGAYDEQFVIGREADKTFAVSSPAGTVKQFFCPEMRRIQALCNGRDLLLSSPDGDAFARLPLQIVDKKKELLQIRRGDNIAAVIDLGNVMAEWLCNKLQVDKLRLYQVVSEVRCATPGRNTLGNYVFAIQDSIEYVNKIITVKPQLTALYFRPNIVLSGTTPLDEIKWSYIQIGPVCFEVSGPDSRIISDRTGSETINWKHAWELPPEVPNNIRVVDGCNISIDLGVNAKIVTEGEINIGDPVFAAY